MSYLPSGLVDLGSAFAVEEEDVLRIRIDSRGRSSEFNLMHRYVSNGSQTDTSYDPTGMDGFPRQHQLPTRGARAMPQPQFQNIDDPSSLESPYFRKCNLRRRRSSDQSAEPEPGFSGSQNDSPQDFEEIDVENVKQSTSSESQALYGNENVVKELKPEYVRWFYKYDQDRKWTPFTGYDSIRMEMRYRNLVLEKEEDQNQEFINGYNQYGTSTNLPEDPAARYGNISKPTPVVNSLLINSSGTASPNRLTNIMSKTWNRAWNPSPKGDSQINPIANETSPKEGYSDNSTTYGTTNCQGQSSGYSSRLPDLESSLEDCNENIIIVRGGLYEADLESWNCVATYWPGDKCQITRGTWFYDGTWQPLSVDHAEKLEEEHLGQFAGVSLVLYANIGNLPESPTKKIRPVIHRVSFCEFHVDWTSPTEIHLFSKAASYKFMRSVGQRLGFQTWGHRVCRGYLKPASIVDRPSEISHVVFVIHGIGQKMDTGRIVRNCASFRETVASLKDKFFPQLNEAKQRAEFFPVEWRSAAKLDGDIVEAITPHKLLSLRQLLNATAMDIMYYTSPLYRTEIQNALRNELNRIYSNFVKRNPDFRSHGGKVSVIAHSLGAVITYDIVTGYMPNGPEPSVPLGSFNHQPHLGGHVSMNGSFQPQIPQHYPNLLFQLEHFFCLGSPLSVFLALRWREPHNPDFRSVILPQMLCKRIYNVFYPTDPVAYRLEPLLNKNYVHIAPLPVHCYGSSTRTKYDEMPRERINKEFSFARSENITPFTGQGQETSSAKSTPQRSFSLKSPPTPTKGQLPFSSESNWGWSSIMKYLKSADNGAGGVMNDGEIGELISPDGNSSPNRDEGNSTPEDVSNEIPNDLEYRMDYVLKESNFSSTYLAALTSHTSYWSSPDTAFFVLTHLHGAIVDPPQAQ